MAVSLTVTIEQVPLATIVRLAGAASAAENKMLEAAMNSVAAAKPALVVIDLTKLDFLASMGMGQLVTLHKALKYHGGRVVLAGPTENVLAALHSVRLGTVMQILPSVDAALWNVS